MPVITPTAEVVPLANMADVEIGLGPVDITRLDQGRCTTLACYLHDEYVDAAGGKQPKDLGGAISRVADVLEAYRLARRTSPTTSAAAAEDFQTSFQYLGLALLISMLLVYMVMASQFESLRQPFIIIFTVPLAAIGVVLMFTLTRSDHGHLPR